MALKHVAAPCRQLAPCRLSQQLPSPHPQPAPPPGGASLSWSSARAAAIGALAALPLAAGIHWSWGPEAASVAPSLPAVHRRQAEDAAPWLAGMGPGHVAAFVGLDTLPLLALLLPAAQGALASALVWYSSCVASADLLGAGAATAGSMPADPLVSPAAAGLAAAALVAAAAGAVRSTEMLPDEDAVAVVKDAVANADR